MKTSYGIINLILDDFMCRFICPNLVWKEYKYVVMIFMYESIWMRILWRTFTNISLKFLQTYYSFYALFANANSYKRIEKAHTFFETESLQSTEIRDVSFIEKDIEEILSNLTEYLAAALDTWNKKFLNLSKSSLTFPFKILWRTSMDSGLIPASLRTCIHITNL